MKKVKTTDSPDRVTKSSSKAPVAAKSAPQPKARKTKEEPVASNQLERFFAPVRKGYFRPSSVGATRGLG